jgi:hypothetical protein
MREKITRENERQKRENFSVDHIAVLRLGVNQTASFSRNNSTIEVLAGGGALL